MESVRHFVIAGADVSNPNLGCAALGLSAVAAMRRCDPQMQVEVLDGGVGRREGIEGLSPRAGLYRVGFRQSRHPLRGDWAALTVASMATRIAISESMRRIARSRAVLDVSGGDSFTDLYGMRRFERVNVPKRASLAFGRPLVFLPQTYGPFRTQEARHEASMLVRASSAAWARDARSFAILQELLGDAFDPERHGMGVDMAFLLPASQPRDARLVAMLSERRAEGPLVGLNVSGLLANDPAAAKERFGLRADYRQACERLVCGLLESGAQAVLLVPHVLGKRGVIDSDPSACEDLCMQLPAAVRERVVVASGFDHASEAKWLVGLCDFFCGTRMHATIAALSSGVPCAAISYSDKTLGVFETCGAGRHVADPRLLDTHEVVAAVLESFRARDAIGRAIAACLPVVKQTAVDQMRRMLDAVRLRGCD